MFNYFGYAGREALSGSENTVKVISLAIGFFLLMSVMPNLVKYLKKNGTTEEES